MNHPFLVSDVLVKSTYSVSPRKRFCQNVALVNESDCFVLNTYNHDLFDIPNEDRMIMEDDSAKKAVCHGKK